MTEFKIQGAGRETHKDGVDGATDQTEEDACEYQAHNKSFNERGQPIFVSRVHFSKLVQLG
jgi:hypothetical protein